MIRTREFIDTLTEHSDYNTGTQSPPSNVETIAFENVEFSYGDEQVLNDVSFEAESGEFVAFVGPSGAGKSTIVSLIARLYVPDAGRITANGEPLENVILDEWREQISLVQQNPFIFNDTLRHNVTVGNRDATEEEIRETCEIAQVTEFMDELPNGLDTTLGDDGVRLSGGQRQRVAVARALLKDVDLLVLDEATSDLDTSLENDIQSNLESEEDDRILVVIAHRLSTVENADRIYAMEDGEITESGTHSELVDRSGTYAMLYSGQSRTNGE